MITFLIVRDTSDNSNIQYSFSYIYNIILSLLCISSFLLLIRTKQDAGEIDINTKGILEREITLSDSSIKLKYTPLMIMKLMPCNGCKHCKIMELPLRFFRGFSAAAPGAAGLAWAALPAPRMRQESKTFS